MARPKQRGISDPDVRPPKAVVISLERLEGGRVRMFIDQAAAVPGKEVRSWSHEVFITASEWPRGLPRLADRDFEDLGRTVWGCLVVAMR